MGARDEKFTGIAREMAKAIPDADLALVPDTGHAVHLEAPEATAAIIAPV